MRSTIRGMSFVVLAALLGVAGCRKAEQPPATQVLAVAVATLPSDPMDAAWRKAPEFSTTLLLQDLVEPRLMQSSTDLIRVRAVTDGREIALRLQWAAAAPNDRMGDAKFSDACAIQFPAKIEPSVPAPQMGETGRPVEITYWRAAWQATVDGRGDSIKDIYPRAAVDHYPFEAASLEKGSPAQREMAARYAPARALENPMAGPRSRPVQDLIAEGPGTITPAPKSDSNGCGKQTGDGWAVVIVRPLPTGLSAKTPTQVALAVWQGAEQEVGSRKMRTGWIPLSVEAKP